MSSDDLRREINSGKNQVTVMRNFTRPELLENRLLSSLPPRVLQSLSPYLESITLTQGRLLYDSGDISPYAYFINSGVVSLIATTKQGNAIQVGVVGNEGIVGAPEVLSNKSTAYRAMARVDVNALKIKAERLRSEFTRDGEIQKNLVRYMRSLVIQLSQSAVCIRFHSVEERLCCWLLTMRDLLRLDAFSFTQESISEMLGISRTLISVAAGYLQQRGSIKYSRAHIRILNRAGLESKSCECYDLIRRGID